MLFFDRPHSQWLLDDLSQITFVLDDVTKMSDMFQNYMDDLSQFYLVLGRFVTKLFWDI